MIVSGIGWMTEQMCGSLRRGWQEEFKDATTLYKQLEEAGVFNTPVKKVRWFGDLAQRFCLTSALALRDAFDLAGQIGLDPSSVGMISLNRDGALTANIEYFMDYLLCGKKSARGNLFINTLPTSPLAQVAMNFGFKGPIFHVSTVRPKVGQLLERAEALAERTPGLNLLCFAGDEKKIISFFLKPQKSKKDKGIYTVAELQQLVGHLWEADEVLEALKVQTGVAL